MSHPKITIITPSYNQGQYLEQTIQSVLDQNYPNLEYMVIDGGSSDNSVDIIKKYEKHLTYWVSEKDQGQSDAINKGLKRASGDVINWLNADDYYEKNALNTIAQFFNDTNALVVCGKVKVFGDQKNIGHITNGTDIYKGNIAKTIGCARTDQPATFYKKEAIEKMGELDTELHYLMDKDWWIKYVFHFGLDRIIEIPDILVNFRLHQDSKTVGHIKQFQLDRDSYYYSIACNARIKDKIDFFERYCHLHQYYQIKNLDFQDFELVKKILDNYFLRRADELYAVNEFNSASLYLKHIEKASLVPEDQKILMKISFRIKYISRWVIYLFRFIKSLY